MPRAPSPAPQGSRPSDTNGGLQESGFPLGGRLRPQACKDNRAVPERGGPIDAPDLLPVVAIVSTHRDHRLHRLSNHRLSLATAEHRGERIRLMRRCKTTLPAVRLVIAG